MVKIADGIGARLRAERDRLGLSQKRLGKACGVSLMTQHRLETDQAAATTVYLQAAQEIGVDLSMVLGGTPTPELQPEDWRLIRACLADVGGYCARHWAECPDDYKWTLVERLYRQRRQQPQTSLAVEAQEEIETLLGVRS